MIVVDEQGKRHEIAKVIVEELYARGLVWYEGCTMCIKEADTDMYQRLWLAVCDFCMGQPIAFDADCHDFVVADMTSDGPYESKGAWLACEPCGVLIEAGDKAGLLARQTERNPLMAQVLKVIHERFWHNYRGVQRLLPKRL